LDRLCDRFEAAWAAGHSPAIEDFLPEAAEADRPALLRELMLVELHYRRQAGECPKPEDYAARFPVLDPTWLAGAAERGAPAPPPTIPGYEILGRLGQGGMGVVYKARQIKLGRLVAVKMVLAGAHAGEEELARFRREAEAVAHLQHPHIVQIYEVGEAEGLPYLALEFMEGGSLDQHTSGTPQAARPAAQLLETVARAVHYAHERGVVHRDLKPANILLSFSREPRASAAADALARGSRLNETVPKITDFGLAKRLDRQTARTRTGAVLGTPSYMAPEQASGVTKQVGPAADVYALGAILYELLTGRPPFKAPTPMETALQVLSDEPVSPSRLQPKLPRDLETICLKCLRKEPHRRYASAAALADDLRRWQDGRPIQARPVAGLERLWYWARRNKRTAVLAGSVLLLLLGVAVVASGATLWIYQEQVRTESERRRADLMSRRMRAERDQKQEALKAEARRRRQARDALDAMSSQVIDEWLGKQKDLLPEHKAFLHKALAAYEEFARETGQDEASRAGVAAAYLRVGGIRRSLGQAKGAKTAYRRSQALYRRLAADFPHQPAYRQQLVQSSNSLANLLAETGFPQAAEAAFRAALAVAKQLAADLPNRSEYRQLLAQSHNSLGILLQNTSRPKAAEAAFRQSLALRKQLAADFANRPDYRRDLAASHNNLGWLLVAMGQPKKAEMAFREALALYKQLAADFPNRLDYRQRLALARNNLGNLLAETDRPKEAEVAYRAALIVYKQLAADFPNRPDYRFELANVHRNQGALLAKTSRPKEAELALGEALAIQKQLAGDFPGRPDYQNDLAATLVNLAAMASDQGRHAQACRWLAQAVPHHQAALRANPNLPSYRQFFRNNQGVMAAARLGLKQHAAAAAAAEGMLRLGFDPVNDLYMAAGFLARCVSLAENDAALAPEQRRQVAQSYGDRALALLQAVARKHLPAMKGIINDKDFAALRGRADFQKLLRDLQDKVSADKKE
jgi:tetratricopeptide (TPR) repeat protein/tRNA A-37 threonylcarbamoyl transferase component Bud32